MKVRFIGAHNVESRRTGMASVVVDDIMALDAGSLASRLSLRDQAKLKAVLITHQHYDHVRDLPALAMNCLQRRVSVSVYSTRPVYEALKSHFFDGSLYPNFLEPREGITAINFVVVAPHQVQDILGYRVEAIPVVHSAPAVGFCVTNPRGQTLFYTGDTGTGLYESWRHVSPHLLIIEVTVSNAHDDHAQEAMHLSPNLLKRELLAFKKLKGYLPEVAVVHMNPIFEHEITRELTTVAQELDVSITVAREGMRLQLPDV